MTDTKSAVSLLVVALSVLLLLAVHEFILKPALVAAFKHSVFTLRRRLFLLVAGGRLEAHGRANVLMRRTMNAALRYAEDLSLLDVIVTLFLASGVVKTTPVADSIRDIENPGVRSECMAIHTEVGVVLGLFLLARAPWAWPFLAGLLVVGLALAVVRGTGDDRHV